MRETPLTDAALIKPIGFALYRERSLPYHAVVAWGENGSSVVTACGLEFHPEEGMMGSEEEYSDSYTYTNGNLQHPCRNCLRRLKTLLPQGSKLLWDIERLNRDLVETEAKILEGKADLRRTRERAERFASAVEAQREGIKLLEAQALRTREKIAKVKRHLYAKGGKS